MTERGMNPTEKKKLKLLLDTYLCVYDSWQFHKSKYHSQKIENLVDETGWWFDWTPIVRECAPEVLVVMSGDRRAPEQFPAYALVPGAGDWFEVHSNPKLVETIIQDAVLGDGSVFDTMQSFDEFRKMISTLPPERRGEAFKHFNALRRIIRPAV